MTNTEVTVPAPTTINRQAAEQESLHNAASHLDVARDELMAALREVDTLAGLQAAAIHAGVDTAVTLVDDALKGVQRLSGELV